MNAELIARAARLATGPDRRILGIAGAPGSGKSTLAAHLAVALGAERAVRVPLDGFHLADEELDRLGRRDRKGAVDTFDAHGYLALLRRLRCPDGITVYAPRFDRHAEAAIAGAIPVPDVPLVITEGNWLLDPEPPWDGVRVLLDEAWFLDVDEVTRLAGLIARHEAHGRSPKAAREWARGSDQRNAERIARGAHRADLRIRLE